MRVVAADPTIDALQQEIEEKPSSPSPAAADGVDLREIVAALRVSTIWSGSATRQEHRQARRRAEGDFIRAAVARVEHMASLVLGQLKQVLDAYASRDLPSAAVWKGDEEIDAMCTSLFRDCSLHDGRSAQHHLLHPPDVLRKDIERMGDHATNIAETVALHGRGKPIAETRPKGDTTAFAKAALT